MTTPIDRLREQAEALAAVVKLARNGHHWCNDADQSANGMAVLCSRVKDIADKADAALRAYREPWATVHTKYLDDQLVERCITCLERWPCKEDNHDDRR